MTYRGKAVQNTSTILDNASNERNRLRLGVLKEQVVEPQTSTGTAAVYSFPLAGTVGGTVTITPDADGVLYNCATTTSSGNQAGMTGFSNNIYTLNASPVLTAKMKTGSASTDIQGCRIWIGSFSASPVAGDTLGSIHGAGFRYSPSIDGTAFWRTVTTTGGGASDTQTTTVAVAADTLYEFRIDATDPANVYFFINNTYVTLHTTGLPSGNTSLAPVAAIYNVIPGTARAIKFGNLFVTYL